MYHVFIWYIDTIIQSLFSQLTHQNTQILAKSTQIEQYSLWVCCFNHSFWSEVFYSLKRLPPVSWFWSSSLSLWVGTITEFGQFSTDKKYVKTYQSNKVFLCIFFKSFNAKLLMLQWIRHHLKGFGIHCFLLYTDKARIFTDFLADLRRLVYGELC